MLDQTDDYTGQQLFTPQSCLSRELLEELSKRNMLTVKSRQKVCRQLDCLATASDETEKRESLRHKAIREILVTEKSYIKQLKTLVTYFVDPLRKILDCATHNLLFGHIEMIYNLNGELISELELDLDNVGSAFLRMAPFLKLYSVYAFDYKKALISLQEISEKNTKFKQFLSDTESRPEVQTKLNSLLIVPIQRVPRYRMLLQQVLLYTSPSDRDFKVLQDSVKQVENTANHINSLIEDQENTQVLINLQNSLVSRNPSIVKPCRKLLREGVLDKITRNGIKVRRYCFLMSDIFMYCKVLRERPNKTLVENSLECCCIFPLKKCKVVELFPGTFRISCQGDGIILQTLDEVQCKLWIVAIKDAIDVHVQFRKTLRKESSKRRPLRKKKDMKNFELESIVSPTRGKKSEYDNVFRVEGLESSSDDDEHSENKSCFRKLKQLKRKSNANSGYEHFFKSKKIRTGESQEIQTEKDEELKTPQQKKKSPFRDTTNERKKRTVRFSDITPVPFKYDDDQEYLNRRFLQKTVSRPIQMTTTTSFTQRVSNFFSKWF